MRRPTFVRATAAAMLPAALSGAVLVSAPFAGTTTAPLADSQPAQPAKPAQPAQPAAQPAHSGGGLQLSVPGTGVAALVGAELALLGVGAGVIVTVRRRRTDS